MCVQDLCKLSVRERSCEFVFVCVIERERERERNRECERVRGTE